MVADREEDKVAEKVDKVGDMVPYMEVEKVAVIEVDKVYDMVADMFKTKCIKPEMF